MYGGSSCLLQWWACPTQRRSSAPDSPQPAKHNTLCVYMHKVMAMTLHLVALTANVPVVPSMPYATRKLSNQALLLSVQWNVVNRLSSTLLNLLQYSGLVCMRTNLLTWRQHVWEVQPCSHFACTSKLHCIAGSRNIVALF